MSVRAKFYVTTIEPYHGGKGGTVKLRPVYSADPAHENKAFWDATPTGEISMQINNPQGFQYFTDRLNDEFYVEFTKA